MSVSGVTISSLILNPILWELSLPALSNTIYSFSISTKLPRNQYTPASIWAPIVSTVGLVAITWHDAAFAENATEAWERVVSEEIVSPAINVVVTLSVPTEIYLRYNIGGEATSFTVAAFAEWSIIALTPEVVPVITVSFKYFVASIVTPPKAVSSLTAGNLFTVVNPPGITILPSW